MQKGFVVAVATPAVLGLVGAALADHAEWGLKDRGV